MLRKVRKEKLFLTFFPETHLKNFKYPFACTAANFFKKGKKEFLLNQ